MIFIGFQMFEFTEFAHEGLTPRSNLFGSTCLGMTGFHGTHVTIGVIWLLSVLAATFFRPQMFTGNPLNVDLVGLYWHFVDIVWIVIFTAVYLVGSFGLTCLG